MLNGIRSVDVSVRVEGAFGRDHRLSRAHLSAGPPGAI